MAVRIVMPKLGMVMAEGTVSRWAKSAGDRVEQGEVIAEIETEKVNYEMEATDGGIFHPIVPEGAIVAVDGLLGYLLANGEAVPEPEVQAAPTPSPVLAAARPRPATSPARGDVVPSTPGARGLAASLGVDLSKVPPQRPSREDRRGRREELRQPGGGGDGIEGPAGPAARLQGRPLEGNAQGNRGAHEPQHLLHRPSSPTSLRST